jgi:hypothetical protein
MPPLTAARRNDIQHNDIHQNDTQHKDIQYYNAQHNKKNAALTVMTLNDCAQFD